MREGKVDPNEGGGGVCRGDRAGPECIVLPYAREGETEFCCIMLGRGMRQRKWSMPADFDDWL